MEKKYHRKNIENSYKGAKMKRNRLLHNYVIPPKRKRDEEKFVFCSKVCSICDTFIKEGTEKLLPMTVLRSRKKKSAVEILCCF